jgi:membrane fusion protein, multidrug efflux system
MRSLMFAFALGAALLSGGCGDSAPNAPVAANTAPVPSTTPPKNPAPAEAIDTGLVVTGPIIVEHQIELTAQRDGILEKVFFDAPTRVKSGTILAQLDDRQITANLEAARAKSRSIAADLKNWEAETEVLKADYVRAQNLWDLGLISQEQLQHAKFKAESDQWDTKRVQELLNNSHDEERGLELELEKTKITAPFDGLIARRYAHEGQSINKGERLFWVTAETPLLMRFTLPERYFGHVRAAQQFELTSPDVPGERHAARIKEISPVIDPSSGTFEVLVELTGERGSLRPGMTANLRVDNTHLPHP